MSTYFIFHFISKCHVKEPSIYPAHDTEAFTFLSSPFSSHLPLSPSSRSFRIQEGLLYIDPYDPVVQNELNSGKFSVLARRDSRTGAAIALFTASLHCPLTASHQSVLKVSHDQSYRMYPHMVPLRISIPLAPKRTRFAHIFNSSPPALQSPSPNTPPPRSLTDY